MKERIHTVFNRLKSSALHKRLEKIFSVQNNCTVAFIYKHKIASATTAVLLVISITLGCILASQPFDTVTTIPEENTSENTDADTEDYEEQESLQEVSSEETVSSEEEPPSSSPTVSAPQPVLKPQPIVVTKPTISTEYSYNTNLDIENNVFMDSLVYTGYNLAKHRADGNMWVYILASRKRGMGYLSKIGYAGGSSGYETNAEGKPDIGVFERRGLVCASYVTYVYFNYLPNVAGIDTSSLTRPVKSYSAHDWYTAAKDWIRLGYSESIPFTASKTSSGFINFKAQKDIPIGSIMVFRDARKNLDHGSHVAIYAGYKNGYHWVFHVGNENGPEFCAVERMHFGPDPQWPLMVISTPKNIRMSAAVEVVVTDDSGAAVSGSEITLKSSNGKTLSLGKTDSNGRVFAEYLSYGEYTVTHTVPVGYICSATDSAITLTTQNNSLNRINLVCAKIPAQPEQTPSSSEEVEASSSEPISSETTEPSQNSNTSDTSSEDDVI